MTSQYETISVFCNDCHQTLYYGATPPKADLDHVKADADRRKARDEKVFRLANSYGTESINRGNYVAVNGVLPPGMMVHEKMPQKLVRDRKDMQEVPEHTGINRDLSDLIYAQVMEDKKH